MAGTASGLLLEETLIFLWSLQCFQMTKDQEEQVEYLNCLQLVRTRLIQTKVIKSSLTSPLH